MPRPPHKTLSPQEQPEETRHTIIRTAERLFMEHGYRAVSTRQIAEACQLTQPALYHYFTDKHHLYVEVMRAHAYQTRVGLESILHSTKNIQDRLQHVVQYLINTTHYDLDMMMHDIQHELPPHHQATLYHLFHTNLILPIASIFEDALRQNLLRSPHDGGTDALTAAHLFMSMLSRFVMNPNNNPDQELTIHRTLESSRAQVIVQILLHGLAKDPSTSQP
jgi:AcrR family transcriptional regulator